MASSEGRPREGPPQAVLAATRARRRRGGVSMTRLRHAFAAVLTRDDEQCTSFAPTVFALAHFSLASGRAFLDRVDRPSSSSPTRPRPRVSLLLRRPARRRVSSGRWSACRPSLFAPLLGRRETPPYLLARSLTNRDSRRPAAPAEDSCDRPASSGVTCPCSASVLPPAASSKPACSLARLLARPTAGQTSSPGSVRPRGVPARSKGPAWCPPSAKRLSGRGGAVGHQLLPSRARL